MRRIRIIAHGERADDPLLAAVVDLLREDGHDVGVRPTWEAGDAPTLALEAFDEGADVIIAAGGDGTVNEVLNGLLSAGATVPVGVLPLGTANDFASSAQMPDDPLVLAQLFGSGETREVDVARIDGRFYLNAATGGFAAEAAGAAPPRLKRALGGLAYFLTGVAKLGAKDEHTMFLEGPGFSWSGSFLGFAVANGRAAGGGHRICPEAYIDDGLLDVVVLPGNESMLQAARVASDLKLQLDENHVLRWQTPWVEVSVPEGTALNVDGEPQRIRRARFEVVPRGVSMLLASGCPLMEGGAIGLE